MIEQWALLWSKRANAFHIERLDDTLASNRRAYVENRASDYLPIFIGSKEICHSTADNCRRTLMSREFGEPELPHVSALPFADGERVVKESQ